MKYDITHALSKYYTDTQWSLSNNDYSTLQWMSPEISIPSEQELMDKILEMDSQEPLRLLRIERNKLLQEVDWVIIKFVSQGKDIPQEWKNYMQSLRDLPQTSSPKLDHNHNLDLNSINWPTIPNL
tara:strand:+ start:1777 stop:2154 length:378 start_codon:yes stop_codon:yes gene_type:complete